MKPVNPIKGGKVFIMSHWDGAMARTDPGKCTIPQIINPKKPEHHNILTY